MTLFEEIVNSLNLLNEDNSGQNDKHIPFAIEHLRRMRFTYDDRKPRDSWRGTKGKNLRNVLPTAYGKNKRGEYCMRGYQTNGSTKRGAPGWKMFIVDNMTNVSVSRSNFKDYKEQLIRLGLNVKGDKGFEEIDSISPFCNGNIQVQKNDKPIDSIPISKEKIEPQPQNQTKQSIDTVPAKEKQSTSVDNTNNAPYLSNSSVDAPETRPITKQQIEPNQQSEPQTQSVSPQQPIPQYNGQEVNNDTEQLGAQDTAPVTKNDIQNNELTRSFKDMMNRMNNLYKDEDEEEKEY